MEDDRWSSWQPLAERADVTNHLDSTRTRDGDAAVAPFSELASMYSRSLGVALMLIRYLIFFAMGVTALPAGPDLPLIVKFDIILHILRKWNGSMQMQILYRNRSELSFFFK